MIKYQLKRLPGYNHEMLIKTYDLVLARGTSVWLFLYNDWYDVSGAFIEAVQLGHETLELRGMLPTRSQEWVSLRDLGFSEPFRIKPEFLSVNYEDAERFLVIESEENSENFNDINGYKASFLEKPIAPTRPGRPIDIEKRVLSLKIAVHILGNQINELSSRNAKVTGNSLMESVVNKCLEFDKNFPSEESIELKIMSKNPLGSILKEVLDPSWNPHIVHFLSSGSNSDPNNS